ncbi:MAG: TrbM/KikA/MpfK family conjugal transfer protein, partial [Gammaproteobacteria bacterium]
MRIAAVRLAALICRISRLACEALLCLSSGSRPSECAPALSRYFGIHKRKFSNTIKARLNFLNLCPVSNQPPEIAAVVSAIPRGAGRCDAASLNPTLVIWHRWNKGHFVISDQLPADCSAYVRHAYTDFTTTTLPRYVGTPERGGYWVEARDYDRALVEYNARIQAEDA